MRCTLQDEQKKKKKQQNIWHTFLALIVHKLITVWVWLLCSANAILASHSHLTYKHWLAYTRCVFSFIVCIWLCRRRHVFCSIAMKSPSNLSSMPSMLLLLLCFFMLLHGPFAAGYMQYLVFSQRSVSVCVCVCVWASLFICFHLMWNLRFVWFSVYAFNFASLVFVVSRCHQLCRKLNRTFLMDGNEEKNSICACVMHITWTRAEFSLSFYSICRNN